jgi:beta-lactamase class A
MRTKFLAVFPFLLVFLLPSCRTSKQVMTPSIELKKLGYKLPSTDSLITNLLAQHPQDFDSLLKQNNQYRIKIIYTQIDRKAHNKPVFSHHYFNILPDEYFYPASTVKMPVAILALQRLHELKIKGLTKNTTLITENAFSGQTSIYNDPSTEDGRPTVAHYIKKIFLVSDNEAYNRLYEFLGQEYINNTLHKMGYDSAQIIHRLNISLSEEQNRNTNPVKFYDTSANILYQQPLVRSNLAFEPRNTLLGSGYYQGDQLVNQPFDFSKKNRMTLVDLHSILMSVLFPKALPKAQRFKLKKEDYQFLYRYMSMKPGESKFPQFDTTYSDAYVKLLLYGSKGRMEDNIRIFNKEGDAYGFLTDIAYIVDFKNNVEFLLSATIYCNSDGIFNDDHYDYETVGYPFMKNLGRVFYEYELQRLKKRLPNLSKFKMSY